MPQLVNAYGTLGIEEQQFINFISSGAAKAVDKVVPEINRKLPSIK